MHRSPNTFNLLLSSMIGAKIFTMLHLIHAFLWNRIISTLPASYILLRGVWEYTSSLQAYLWTKIQIVCQVQLLTSWSCWTWSDILDRGGISHMLLSGSERTSPPTLDSNLIHGEVWRAWWCWLDSAVSHRWKWSEVCKIVYSSEKGSIGCAPGWHFQPSPI